MNKGFPIKRGNKYDDLRVDIQKVYEAGLPWRKNSFEKQRKKSLFSWFRRSSCRILFRLRLWEWMVCLGPVDRWFHDFREYWQAVLGGRPLWTRMDFFHLRHDYRKRHQMQDALAWDTPADHVANWQDAALLYGLFQQVAAIALNPLPALDFWRLTRSRGLRILEYGCSSAPYYHCYREFFRSRKQEWVLADLPNFPFHFAQWLYQGDSEVSWITIKEENFTNPLGEEEGFDAVILTTVLEHVDDPVRVIRDLLSRLKDDGILLFDFVVTAGTGLDHPQGVDGRLEALALIEKECRPVVGEFPDIHGEVGLTIVRKSN